MNSQAGYLAANLATELATKAATEATNMIKTLQRRLDSKHTPFRKLQNNPIENGPIASQDHQNRA